MSGTAKQLPQLRIAESRYPTAGKFQFAIEGESDFPSIYSTVALVAYKPHAEEIVRAVNCHDEAKAALERIAAWSEAPHLVTLLPLIHRDAKAALSRMEG